MKFYAGKAYRCGEIYTPSKEVIQRFHDPEHGEIVEFNTDFVWEGYDYTADDPSYLVHVVHEGNLVAIAYNTEGEWKEGKVPGYKHVTYKKLDRTSGLGGTTYANGYIDGHKDGYDDGYKDGHNEGYKNGWEDGYNDGYENGYNLER